mmetsp:Transcript_7788/g.17847  ORF Transcript_7788/g.17847 Transcript_7788/m.17847 type:complete len:207 (+) Transcript_7788:26-646(+)
MGKNEIKQRARLIVQVVAATDLEAADRDGSSDPYVWLAVGDDEEQTEVQAKKLNPTWDAQFLFTPKDDSKPLKVVCYDKDTVGSDKLGQVEIPLVPTTGFVDNWYPMNGSGKLHLRTHYITIEALAKFYNEEVQARKKAAADHEAAAARAEAAEKELAELKAKVAALEPEVAQLKEENEKLKGSAGHKMEEGVKGAASKVKGLFGK